MEVTILQDKLEKSVASLSRIITQKAQLPILSNIFFSAKEGELVLATTNLNESIKITTPAKVTQEGQITVPGKLFAEFIHLLPNKPVLLSLRGQILHASCENIEADFSTIPATEYPNLPQFTEPSLFTLSVEVIKKLTMHVTFAASKDEGRPVLTGSLLKINDEGLLLVATDGFRLSLAKEKLNIGKSEQTLLIPAKALEEFVRLASDFLKEKEAMIQVAILPQQNQVITKFGNIEFSFRLLEGTFPDYEKVIPKETTTSVVADREDLLGAVRLTSVFSRDGLSVVKMNVTTDGVILSSDAKEIGSDVIKIDAQVEGEGGEIAFNPRFLLELLQSIDTKEINIAMSGPLSPAIFYKQPQDGFLHVIMPVRT